MKNLVLLFLQPILKLSFKLHQNKSFTTILGQLIFNRTKEIIPQPNLNKI